MKINVKIPLVNYEGKEVKDVEDRVVTLRKLIDMVINIPLKDEVATGELKNKVGQINRAIYGGNIVDLTETQRAYIIECSEKQPRSIISAMMHDFIKDNLSDKVDDKNEDVKNQEEKNKKES